MYHAYRILTRKQWQMKHFPNNPRQITSKQLERLKDKLARLGDLSGVVHNQRTDEIIGGNQRMVIFGEGSKPVIIEQYEIADEQGTLAWGFIEWQGKKYNYRLVDWDIETTREANIAANLEGGAWNWDILANSWPDMGEFGFTDDLLKEWKTDIAALDNFLKSEQPSANGESQDIPEQYAILITCQNEHEQTDLLERFIEEGLECRALLS